MDAIWFGCVPVLLADHYIPPLPMLVNWDEVAITVPEKEVGLVDCCVFLKNKAHHKRQCLVRYNRNKKITTYYMLGVYCFRSLLHCLI